MDLAELVEAHLASVREFVSEIEDADSPAERERELQRVARLIRFAREFYEQFFAECYAVRVGGFSFRDKRRVSRRLIREERRRAAPDTTQRDLAALDLAVAFEDLCDLLHGDLEFGYSDDYEDYVTFHAETFPRWLDLLAAWLAARGQEETSDDVEMHASDYRQIVSSEF